MKKLLLTLMLFTLATMGFTQTPTDGDYRSIASGNWSDPTKWQIRTAGNWVAASVEPSASNNVYLQTGHAMVIDAASANCKDLHWGYKGTTYGSVTLGTNFININGKVRVYVITGSAVTAAGTDGAFYSDQTSSTVTNAGQFLSSTTSGYIKFVGNTRDITLAGEWNGNGTVCNGVFALTAGQTGTLNTGFKFRKLDFESGNIVSNNGALVVGSTANTGDITIKNGAKFSSSRSTQVITQGSSANCGTVLIEAGGILELTNNNPEINCTTFTNNGTVVYSGTSQNFAKSLLGGADPLTTYSNLTVSATTLLTLPASSNITVSSVLSLTSGNLAIPSTSTLELTNANTAVSGGNASNYIQTLVSGAASGILKVTGLSSSKTFPIGSATDYLPITLNPVSASNFSINTFTGATTDGTPNGAAYGTKADIVDAIYNISRTLGTGNCDVTLGWQAGLEGANFTGFSDAQVGVAKYTGGAYSSFIGPGDNTGNTITTTITDNVFAPFLIGKVVTLPVTLISFTAKAINQTSVLNWKVSSETSLSHYLVQRSTNGITFETLKSVKANNKAGIFDYSFTDQSPAFGENYYQLVSVDADGKTNTSKLEAVNFGSVVNLSVYPNPTKGIINITGLTKGDVVKVADLIGRILNVKQSNGENVMSLNIDDANPGIYLVSVSKNGKIISSSRIIKN